MVSQTVTCDADGVASGFPTQYYGVALKVFGGFPTQYYGVALGEYYGVVGDFPTQHYGVALEVALVSQTVTVDDVVCGFPTQYYFFGQKMLLAKMC